MKFGFYSCMDGMPWGGSEELWWRAARRLQERGHEIAINYQWWKHQPAKLTQIEKFGASLYLRNRPVSFWRRHAGKMQARFSSNGHSGDWLYKQRPDMLLVTLGFHPDRIDVADRCRELGIPYAINVQSASDTFFLHSCNIDEYRRWYLNARKVYFVSDENQQKLETNIAAPLPNAEIVANPFNVMPKIKTEWPDDESVWRLACVGRLHFQSKGQDLLVKVMRNPKWQTRPIHITFYGADQGNRMHLEEMIRHFGLEKFFSFGGFVNDLAEIWNQNHGLILPSRYEGAALSIVEAMLCRRVCITTATGRNEELLDECETGFIAPFATEQLMDEALERAWKHRARWREMGELARKRIRERYPIDPVGEFAKKLGKVPS